MNKYLFGILLFAGFILLSGVTYLGFYNAFYSPRISVQEEGGETIVYLETELGYSAADSLMKLVFHDLYEVNGIVITKGFTQTRIENKFGEDVELNILKAGCIVEQEDLGKLAKINTDFQIGKTPKQKYILSDFPLKGKMSLLFGFRKVVPKLLKYADPETVPSDKIWEIYDRKQRRIHYRLEIKNAE